MNLREILAGANDLLRVCRADGHVRQLVQNAEAKTEIGKLKEETRLDYERHEMRHKQEEAQSPKIENRHEFHREISRIRERERPEAVPLRFQSFFFRVFRVIRG